MENHWVWGLVPAALAPLLCSEIRANGDKRTEGLWLSWGWKGGGNPFSKLTFCGQIKKRKGETVDLCWGQLGPPEFLFLKVALGNGV